MALEIGLACHREACGLEQLEIWLAREPDESKARTIRDVQTNVLRMAQAFSLLKALVPHEDAVWALIDGSSS